MNKNIKAYIDVATEINRTFKPFFEAYKTMQTQLYVPSLGLIEAMKPFVDMANVLKQTMNPTILDIMEGLIIDLPKLDATNIVSISSGINIKFERITQTDTIENEFILNAKTLISKGDANISLEYQARIDMRLQSMERNHDEVMQYLKYLEQKVDKKDQIIDDLISYIKITGSMTAKIEGLKYKHEGTVQLVVMNKEISLPRGKQSMVCDVFFESDENLHKVWAMDEFVEATGDHPQSMSYDELQECVESIYQASYQVNKSVRTVLGLSKGEDFIMFTQNRQEIYINPKFLQ